MINSDYHNCQSFFSLPDKESTGVTPRKDKLEIPAGQTHHFLHRLLAVHEATWNGIGGEDLVALTELLEEDAVGESLAADTDTLQHTVAAQLIQHKGGVDLASLQEQTSAPRLAQHHTTAAGNSCIQHSSQCSSTTPTLSSFLVLQELRNKFKNKNNSLPQPSKASNKNPENLTVSKAAALRTRPFTQAQTPPQSVTKH